MYFSVGVLNSFVLEPLVKGLSLVLGSYSLAAKIFTTEYTTRPRREVWILRKRPEVSGKA